MGQGDQTRDKGELCLNDLYYNSFYCSKIISFAKGKYFEYVLFAFVESIFQAISMPEGLIDERQTSISFFGIFIGMNVIRINNIIGGGNAGSLGRHRRCFSPAITKVRSGMLGVGEMSVENTIAVRLSRNIPLGMKYWKKKAWRSPSHAVRYAIYRCRVGIHFVPDGTVSNRMTSFYLFFAPKGAFIALSLTAMVENTDISAEQHRH